MVIISLALGVAIFVSSYESVVAAEASIESSARTMMGRAEWQVSRGRYLGIEEKELVTFRKIKNAVVAPVIESAVTTGPPNNQSFMLMGIDLDSDSMAKLYGSDISNDVSAFVMLKLAPTGIIISSRFAQKNHLSTGSKLKLETKDGMASLDVVAISNDRRLNAAAAGNIGFMELHAAEAFLGTPGRVDRFDVAGASRKQLEAACPSCQINPSGQLSSAATDALGRIHSLLGVSVIALLVGVLLIYNSVQVSVLERVKDIAIIRAIGATRSQILGFLLAEWVVIGLIGSGLGLALGLALAYALVEYTKRTINTMVPLMGDAHVHASMAMVASGIAVGVGTTLAAAIFPIFAVSKVKPLEILRPYTFRRAHHYLAASITGICLCVGGNLAIAEVKIAMVPGLCITGIVFLGVALVFPEVVLVAARWIRPLLLRSKHTEPFLALDGLVKTPHRTAFTIMTFGCALAMTIATETLVEGFKVSTGQWMNSAFPFDITVVGNDISSSVYGNQTLPASLIKDIRAIPGAAHAYGVRKLLTPVMGQDAMVIGVDTDDYLVARQYKGLSPWPPNFEEPQTLSKFKAGQGTFISANFEQIYGIHPGSSLHLQTPTGSVNLLVLGSVDDYSWQHGAFIVDRSLIRSRWKDVSFSYIDITAASGTSLDSLKATVVKVAGTSRTAFAYDRQEIREVTDSVLEQAVQMANMQAAIAVLIGTLGIVNAIWIGVMNRKKEIALWRSIGVTRTQVLRIILCEGLFVSIVAAILGVAGGLYGGWVPLRAFSFGVTGYIYPMVVPWVHVGVMSALALVLGITAGLMPAIHAAKLPILESIGYE